MRSLAGKPEDLVADLFERLDTHNKISQFGPKYAISSNSYCTIN